MNGHELFYDVKYYEADYKKRVLITSVMNYFQDLVVKDSEKKEIGLDFLKEHNMAWVIAKWDITFEKYPSFKDNLLVKTIPIALKSFYAHRRFEVWNENSELVISANTLWILINTKTRKPVKIDSVFYDAYGLGYENNDKLDFEKLQIPEHLTAKNEFTIRYTDIDTNEHVNNVKFVEWAMQTVPLEVIMSKTLCRIQIEYKKEALYGDSVLSCSQMSKKEESIEFQHLICDSSMEKEFAVLKSTWK
jgi:medium-chain acyl-[acyl-carrier-protein] hydrolase